MSKRQRKLSQFKTPCADQENFVRGGPTLTNFFFLLDEVWEDPNTTISGSSPARRRNAI